MKGYLAILAGFALTWLVLKLLDVAQQDRTRWMGIWVVLTGAAFFAGHFLIFAVVIAIACAVLSRKMRGDIPALYAVLLPLIPAFSFYIPGALGINYLLLITYVHVLIIALLLPAYLAYRRSARPGPAMRSTLDVFVITYCLWQMLGLFIHMLSFTDAIRGCVDISIVSLLPYLAISRLLRTREQLNRLLIAIVFTGLIQFGVCFAEAFVGQSPYLDLVYRLKTNAIPGLTYLTQIRFGFPRVRGTIDGGLGLLLVGALSALLTLSRMRRSSPWKLWLGVLFLVMPIVLTGSRATWIMAAMMLAIRIGYPLFKTPARFTTVVLIALFLIPYMQDLLLSTNDEFGTFRYRQDLLDTFYPVIFEKPFFGWGGLTQVFATGRFYHLIQGEGIIDMVNTFLGVGLQLGVTGVILFCGIFFFSVVPLLRRLQSVPAEVAQQEGPYVVWVCSLMPPLAFFLATTSLVGHTSQYFFLFAAVAAALCERLAPSSDVDVRRNSGPRAAAEYGEPGDSANRL